MSLVATVSAQNKTDNDRCDMPVDNGTAITLTVGDTVIPAVLNNTDTARDLIARLPYTLSLHRDTHDFCGVMSEPLKHDPADVRHGWKNGDIHFATDGDYFVRFFAGEELSERYGHQVHIGKMDVEPDILPNLGGRIEVTIALDNKRK